MSFSGLSMSRLDRAEKCIGSVALDGVGSEAGEPAKIGTAIHALVAAAHSEIEKAQGEISEAVLARALSAVPEQYRELCSRVPLDRLPIDPSAYSAEVALAYDVQQDSARELGRDIGREYGYLEETEIPGSADLMGIDGDCGVVIDLKTGRYPPRAATCLQIQTYGLCLARLHNVKRVKVAILHLPAFSVEQEPRWDEHELDLAELDSLALRLEELHGRYREAREAWAQDKKVPALCQGEHCRYCPVFQVCPAKVALLAGFGAGSQEAQQAVAKPLDEATASRVYAWVESAQGVLDVLRKTLEEWGTEHPFPVDGDRVFGPHSSVRTTLGDPTLIVEAKWGPKAGLAVQSALSKSISREALRSAIRPFVEQSGEKITAAFDGLIAAMKENGCATIKESTTIGPYKPKEQK